MPEMNDLFLRACRREPVPRPPVWMMRQAGRYLPEYRAVRAKADFLTMCHTPELATEVTLQPVDLLGVDAAIIFSDILVIPAAMGMDLTVDEGIGPRLGEPVRSLTMMRRLHDVEPEDGLKFHLDALRMTRRALNGRVPLIGFAGAPWTLFAYMVEGKGTKTFNVAKQALFSDPEFSHRLLERLADNVGRFLVAQAAAGAQALQIFDSWAGQLSRDDYLSYALPYTVEVIDELKSAGVPIILFAKGVHSCFPELSRSGAHVLGVDWTSTLDRVGAEVEGRVVLQGNLDPVALFGPISHIERQAQRILNEARGLKGHIFNLGHGILPPTKPEHLGALVDCVHREGVTRVPRDLG